MPNAALQRRLNALADRLVQSRLSSANGYARLYAMLGAEQKAVVDDESPMVACHNGRRSGKTTTAICAALKRFEIRRAARVAYFAPSEEQGEAIVWDDIRELNRVFDLGLTEHYSDRLWRRGAARFELYSYYSRRQSEAARGQKFDLVIVDEAQLGQAWFGKFIDEAIMPTTLDYFGQIMLLGTPSEVAEGYFFRACHSLDWSNKHSWNCTRNPFFSSGKWKGEDPLVEARRRFKLTEDMPKYKREWLGQWVVDPEALVFRVPESAYKADGHNDYYAYVTGVDLGWNDRDAICVLGVSRDRSHVQEIHTEEKAGQSNRALFDRIMALQVRYPGIVAVDAGGLGKKIVESFRLDAPQVMWRETEKQRKLEYIELLNADLADGRAFIRSDSILINEAKRMRWKKPGKVDDDAYHSDALDAYLYGWREARTLLRELPSEKRRSLRDDPFVEEMERLERLGVEPARSGYFGRRRKELM